MRVEWSSKKTIPSTLRERTDKRQGKGWEGKGWCHKGRHSHLFIFIVYIRTYVHPHLYSNSRVPCAGVRVLSASIFHWCVTECFPEGITFESCRYRLLLITLNISQLTFLGTYNTILYTDIISLYFLLLLRLFDIHFPILCHQKD